MNEQSTHPKSGFTLLELMVAMVILVIALSIAFQAFSGTIRGWKRGTEIMENLKHGEFAMLQLANALNSTVYFSNDKKSYGFIKEFGGGTDGFPADSISWVTASSSFIPPNSPFRHGPHRLRVYIDTTDDGKTALFASAMPTLADEDDFEEEPILVTTGIQGIECKVYDKELDDWVSEWEEENSIPQRIKISLYVQPDDDDDEPIIFSRVIEIPVAASVELRLKGPTSGAEGGGDRNNPERTLVPQ